VGYSREGANRSPFTHQNSSFRPKRSEVEKPAFLLFTAAYIPPKGNFLFCLYVDTAWSIFRIDVDPKEMPSGAKAPFIHAGFSGTAEAVPLTKHVYTITKKL